MAEEWEFVLSDMVDDADLVAVTKLSSTYKAQGTAKYPSNLQRMLGLTYMDINPAGENEDPSGASSDEYNPESEHPVILQSSQTKRPKDPPILANCSAEDRAGIYHRHVELGHELITMHKLTVSPWKIAYSKFNAIICHVRTRSCSRLILGKHVGEGFANHHGSPQQRHANQSLPRV